jgi:hypothetical protein
MIEPIEADDRRNEQSRADVALTAVVGSSAVESGVTLITRPDAHERKVIDVRGATSVRFDFTLADVTVSIADVDVVLTFANGGRITMPSFVLNMIAAEPPKLFLRALEIDPQALIASAGEIRLVDQLPQLTISENVKPQDQPRVPCRRSTMPSRRRSRHSRASSARQRPTTAAPVSAAVAR